VLRRIDPDEAAAALAAGAGGARAAEAVVSSVAHTDFETTGLPHDHPRWVRDAIAVSQRARRSLEKLAPAITMAVFSVWEHRLRYAVVAGHRVRIDGSGSYRADP